MTAVNEHRPMSRDERRELRAAIKLQIRDNQAELNERKAHLDAEVNERLRERFQAVDDAIAKFNKEVEELKKATEAQLKFLMDSSELNQIGGGRWTDHRYNARVDITAPTWTAETRASMGGYLRSKLNAEMNSAQLLLNRRESELMTKLIRDALISPEAIAFLDEIPLPDSILPPSRVLELEATYDEERAS